MKRQLSFLMNVFLSKKTVLILGVFAFSFSLLLPQLSQATPIIYLYEHTGYTGTPWTIWENISNFNNCPMTTGKSWNDQASSIKVTSDSGAKARATLYQHTGYGGISKVFTSDNSNFNNISGPSGEGTWNDEASSIKVCEDHCSGGNRQCTDSNHYMECITNFDDDPCTEWSNQQSCPSGKECSGAGVCSTPPCNNESGCDYSGKTRCVNNNTGYQTCGNYDTSDPCLEWSSTTNCSSGQTCSAGTCSAPANQKPNTPPKPSGPGSGNTNTSYSYYVTTTDPNNDDLLYTFDWGDGNTYQTFRHSGQEAKGSHSWANSGTFNAKVKACDDKDLCSNWSPTLAVSIGTPPPSCTDECSPSGKRECDGTGKYKTCEDHDGDGCLEWKTFNCSSGQTCSGGACSIPPGLEEVSFTVPHYYQNLSKEFYVLVDGQRKPSCTLSSCITAATLANSGCYPTSAAMVLAYYGKMLGGGNDHVENTADRCTDYGCRVPTGQFGGNCAHADRPYWAFGTNGGFENYKKMYLDLDLDAEAKWGENNPGDTSFTLQDVKEKIIPEIATGFPVILTVKPYVASCGGCAHAVVATGYKIDGPDSIVLYINDPAGAWTQVSDPALIHWAEVITP